MGVAQDLTQEKVGKRNVDHDTLMSRKSKEMFINTWLQYD